MKRNLIKIYSLLILSMLLISCSKNWLEAKPDKTLVVPIAIKDYQALLDNTNLVFNTSQSSGLGEMSSGDFYITDASWKSLFSFQEKSAYTWEETNEFYKGELSTDWGLAYKRILNSNIILDGIGKIKPSIGEQEDWNRVKGSALFFRAFDFYSLSQEYCKPYITSSAATDLGLPLRLDYDINIRLKRSNLEEVYSQVINDLKTSGKLLSTEVKYKTRPSKQAVFALLSRVYLSMEAYNEAGLYADSALQIQEDLIDYSTLNANATYPIARFNPEVILHNTFSYGIFNATRLIVEPTLYASYEANDCRKTVFFKATGNVVSYKGNYSGDKNLFGGLATDELYLTRAECNVRAGNITKGLEDLNFLLRKRWRGSYQDFFSGDLLTALSKILLERRKELVFRGTRWSDLRRLNRDSRFAVTLTRSLNGQVYSLSPNDKKYVFPIDEEEIRLTEIQQNDR